jgi:Fe-Mn family superoxide dismutase
MKTFQEKTFNIGELKGISVKTIEEHLKLYFGYVKNVNDLLASGQYDRRFPFEYNGMRNHEVYFDSLSGGAKNINPESELSKELIETFSSVETFLTNFKALALTRGVGWAVLWYDRKDKRLLTSWVDEQHLGQLNGCDMILALDMWEHSFVADYQPSGKKNYIEDFFANLNWETIEKNYQDATR